MNKVHILQRAIIPKKNMKTVLKFPLGNLLIILHQLTKVQAPSYDIFQDILKSKFAKGNN